MIKRTTQQWLSLFEAHTQSGLSAAAFCRQQSLCPKYFALRKKQLLVSDTSQTTSANFVKVQTTEQSVTLHDTQTIKLRGQFGEVLIQGQVTADRLGSVLKQLS